MERVLDKILCTEEHIYIYIYVERDLVYVNTLGQRFFFSAFFFLSRIYTKRELHHVRVGNLAGGVGISRTSLYLFLRRRARRHLMELLCIV